MRAADGVDQKHANLHAKFAHVWPGTKMDSAIMRCGAGEVAADLILQMSACFLATCWWIIVHLMP